MNRTQSQIPAAFAVLVLALAGCSDGDDGERSVSVSAGETEVSASIDAVTAQLALDELATNVDATVTGFSSGNPASPTGGASTAPNETSLNVRCSAGGDARVGGYVNVVPVPVLVDVKVAIQYNGCVTNTGTMLAGEIEFSQMVAAAGTPLRVETIYQGDVVLSGRVNARCAIDLNVLVDETGRAIEIGGTFCGQDASLLDLRIAPRWDAP